MSTNLSSLPVTTLGTPRIGPRRELKLALESFWSGASSQQALIDTGTGLRAANWARQLALMKVWVRTSLPQLLEQHRLA